MLRRRPGQRHLPECRPGPSAVRWTEQPSSRARACQRCSEWCRRSKRDLHRCAGPSVPMLGSRRPCCLYRRVHQRRPGQSTSLSVRKRVRYRGRKARCHRECKRCARRVVWPTRRPPRPGRRRLLRRGRTSSATCPGPSRTSRSPARECSPASCTDGSPRTELARASGPGAEWFAHSRRCRRRRGGLRCVRPQPPTAGSRGQPAE